MKEITADSLMKQAAIGLETREEAAGRFYKFPILSSTDIKSNQ